MESPRMGRTAGLRRDGALGRLRRLHPRPGGLRRYGGLGSRMARSAGLKLSRSPRSTGLYSAGSFGDARLGGTRMRSDARLELAGSGAGLHLPGVRRDARLHLAGPSAGLHHARSSRATRLNRTGLNRAAGLHLAGPAGRPGLKLSGPSRGSGGCRLSRQGGSHRTDLLIGRQLLNLPLLLRGQLHGGPGR